MGVEREDGSCSSEAFDFVVRKTYCVYNFSEGYF